MCIIWLMRQQQEDPTFYVDAHFEGQNNHFVRFCWMCPSQLQLWDQFHDVVLLNTTAKMNRYLMILCVIILIDNHNRSHLAATALLSDETKDTFLWLFSSLLRTTGGLIPKLLFTDADPTMIAAVSNTWPTTKHHFSCFIFEKTWKTFSWKIVVRSGKNFLENSVMRIIVMLNLFLKRSGMHYCKIMLMTLIIYNANFIHAERLGCYVLRTAHLMQEHKVRNVLNVIMV